MSIQTVIYFNTFLITFIIQILFLKTKKNAKKNQFKDFNAALKEVIEDDIMYKYNLDGNYSKKCFKDLAFYEILMGK